MQKMKNLRILGITSLALGGISFILLLVSMMIPANPYLDPTQYNALIALLVVGSIMMGISGLISLMGSIMILVSDFDNQEVNGSKVL
jgi:ABC-type transport system involved in cytochrome c biogenesis permease subunit